MPMRLPRKSRVGAVHRSGVVLAMALLAAGAPASASNSYRKCTIDAVSGGSAQLAVGSGWQPVGVGESISVKARIRTGAETRLHISCDDGISVTVGTATEVSLNNLVGPSGHDRSIGLKLLSGIAGFLAPHRDWKKFDVATDVAIASVRSTEWLVGRDRDGTTAVFTRKGLVEVQVGSARLSVGAGGGVTISPDAVAGPVKTWGAARIAKAGKALGYDWQ